MAESVMVSQFMRSFLSRRWRVFDLLGSSRVVLWDAGDGYIVTVSQEIIGRLIAIDVPADLSLREALHVVVGQQTYD